MGKACNRHRSWLVGLFVGWFVGCWLVGLLDRSVGEERKLTLLPKKYYTY
jgi:hypothetical protein